MSENEERIDKEEYRLCDFSVLCGAVNTCNENDAKEWYEKEYLASNYSKTSNERIRALKNGLIVIFGYMRSTIMHRIADSSALLIEIKYISFLEYCSTEQGIFKLFLSAFREFSSKLVEIKENREAGNSLKQCIDYISSNLYSVLNLRQIALYCGYNPSYLSRKFKAEYGMNITSYILGERLKCAAAELRYTEKTILEISSGLKFASQSHFQKIFKSHYGITPLQYRNQFKDTEN